MADKIFGFRENKDKVEILMVLNHSKSGTVHDLTGFGDADGSVIAVFKAVADYIEGDTLKIDDVSYTIKLSNGEPADTNLFVTGATVEIVVDTESKVVNFKAGGVLSASKLALATAVNQDVVQGKTYYSGDKILKTGNLVEHGAVTEAISQAVSNQRVSIRFPQGAYRTNSGSGYPELTIPQGVIDVQPSYETSLLQQVADIVNNGSAAVDYTFSMDARAKAKSIIAMCWTTKTDSGGAINFFNPTVSSGSLNTGQLHYSDSSVSGPDPIVIPNNFVYYTVDDISSFPFSMHFTSNGNWHWGWNIRILKTLQIAGYDKPVMYPTSTVGDSMDSQGRTYNKTNSSPVVFLPVLQSDGIWGTWAIVGRTQAAVQGTSTFPTGTNDYQLTVNGRTVWVEILSGGAFNSGFIDFNLASRNSLLRHHSTSGYYKLSTNFQNLSSTDEVWCAAEQLLTAMGG